MVVFAETPVSAGDGRSHPTKTPPMGDSVKSVSDQLLQTATSTNVVSAEIRTVQKNDSPLKGEAVPVLTDDDVHAVGPYSYKISSDGSTRPTGDLSTWILLGGDSSPAPLNMATIKKVPKPADTTVASLAQSYETTTRRRKPTTEKTSTTHSPVTESSIKLQDSKFKNKTPVIVGKIPTITTVKDKVEESTSPLPELPPLDNNTRFGTPVVTFPHVPPRQRPSANNTKKASQEKPLTTKITSTAVVISKPINNNNNTLTTVVPTLSTSSPATTTSAVQNSTEVPPSTTTESNGSTVKNTSPKKKKKKKNKNKRRPVKTSTDDAQSKIDEQSTKITPGRPLSTRIYNYLAREVMPNVGVGLIGLVLTAGLAGLMLYSPLAGPAAVLPVVPLRRNDAHVHGHSSGHGHGAGYVPPETDNSQPEEQVFGQVLSGMNYGHNPYGRERPDAAVPKYKPSSFKSSEYAAVHDVPKYNAHETAKYSSNHDAAKYGVADATKYSTTHDGTKFAVVESTKYSGPDAADKYSAATADTGAAAFSAPADTGKFSAPDATKYSTIDADQGDNKVLYSSADASQAASQFDETQNGQDQTYQNHHYDRMKFDPSNAYEQQPEYHQSGLQAKDVYREAADQTAFEAPKYPGYVQDVPKDESVGGVSYSFDNHRSDEKETAAAASSADPTFSALQGVPPSFYDPSSEQISVNVRQTMKMEHGPRSLRMRRQVDELNEIDAQLPDETTTPKSAEQTDVVQTTTENQTTGDGTTVLPTTTTQAAAAATTDAPKTPPTTTEPTAANNKFSLVDLLRRVAEVKLKMGIEILRNTAASFTQYVNAIQRRMTHMVRSLQKSSDRQQADSKQHENVSSESSTTVSDAKRQRRSVRHRIYSN